MTIYEITGQYLELYENINALDVDEETKVVVLGDTLESIDFDGVFEDKAENYARVIKQLMHDSEGLKQRKKALESRIKVKETAAKELKERLKSAMQTVGKPKFETGEFVFNIVKNKAWDSVIIAEGTEIPEMFLKPPKPPEPDSKLLTNALQNGVVVEGCELKKGESLVIK
jgi:hypothetical protein